MPEVSKSVEVSRRIEAPVALIFEVLADPQRHMDFDGSGMLRGAALDRPISGVWRTVRNEAVESRNPRIFAVFDADPESATNTPDVLAIREAGRTP